jgi:hypothetical protein
MKAVAMRTSRWPSADWGWKRRARAAAISARPAHARQLEAVFREGADQALCRNGIVEQRVLVIDHVDIEPIAGQHPLGNGLIERPVRHGFGHEAGGKEQGKTGTSSQSSQVPNHLAVERPAAWLLLRLEKSRQTCHRCVIVMVLRLYQDRDKVLSGMMISNTDHARTADGLTLARADIVALTAGDNPGTAHLVGCDLDGRISAISILRLAVRTVYVAPRQLGEGKAGRHAMAHLSRTVRRFLGADLTDAVIQSCDFNNAD